MAPGRGRIPLDAGVEDWIARLNLGNEFVTKRPRDAFAPLLPGENNTGRHNAVGVLSRLQSLRARFRALMRAREGMLAPSQQDIEAFALNRYSPRQQHEIAKVIARQPIISRGDIAEALERAERRTRRTGR